MKQIFNNQITQILSAENNTKDTLDLVFKLMYVEIKKIANNQIFKLNTGETITPTVLVNECYLKLSVPENLTFENRKHFIYTIARCMRQYLVDRVKLNNRQKRARVNSQESITSVIGESDINFELLDLDAIISKLDQINSNLAELAVLKFFSGYSLEQIATIQNVSRSTIMRNWKKTKSFIISLKQFI